MSSNPVTAINSLSQRFSSSRSLWHRTEGIPPYGNFRSPAHVLLKRGVGVKRPTSDRGLSEELNYGNVWYKEPQIMQSCCGRIHIWCFCNQIVSQNLEPLQGSPRTSWRTEIMSVWRRSPSESAWCTLEERSCCFDSVAFIFLSLRFVLDKTSCCVALCRVSSLWARRSLKNAF